MSASLDSFGYVSRSADASLLTSAPCLFASSRSTAATSVLSPECDSLPFFSHYLPLFSDYLAYLLSLDNFGAQMADTSLSQGDRLVLQGLDLPRSSSNGINYTNHSEFLSTSSSRLVPIVSHDFFALPVRTLSLHNAHPSVP